MTFGNIDRTALLCNRIDETRAFYTEIMQFPIEIDTPNWVSFRVAPPAIEACYVELSEKNVPILREPTDISEWRHRTLFFRDPEQNIIELLAEY